MPTGLEQKSQTEITVEKFQQLQVLRDGKIKELASKEKEAEIAKASLVEVVNELKDKGINSTIELDEKIVALQTELGEGLAIIDNKLKEVIHED